MTKHLTTTALALVLSAGAVQAQELSILSDASADTVAVLEALTAAYSEQNPGVSFDIETRPGGGDGDNIVKTRLATGEMADIFQYNSGSLVRALRPDRTMIPLSDLPNLGNINEGFLAAVADGEGEVYGVPIEAAMGGGIFYHVPTYESLGLEIPTTWDAFMANNAAIAEQTDVAPIAQTYRDTWTSQLFVLADYYNVAQAEPDFAESYTANGAKYATTPAALQGFERLQEAFEAGYFNEDFGAASYDDGLAMIAQGEAAHYPMLTFAIGAIQQNFPDHLDDVGFFAQPGDDADSNGLTTWMPAGLYGAASSENPDAVKDFLNWVATVEACNIITETIGATGPYLIKGCELPADVPRSVADMMPYFQEDGRVFPALEFLSPVKGPALEQFTVEVGSGIRSAADAAELYDQDVAKQARQLGLEGW